ncbi:hypothetical protein C0J52_01060 [Blattella germanica]|nr:hypothetical protein C0J52_01060 [Blattella germanica]
MQHVLSYKKPSTQTFNASVAVQNSYSASPVEVSVFKPEIKTCHQNILKSSCLQNINMVSK